MRSRAEGISRCASLREKVRAWAAVTGAKHEPLLADLERLSHQSPEQIAAEVLSRSVAAERAGEHDLFDEWNDDADRRAFAHAGLQFDMAAQLGHE